LNLHEKGTFNMAQKKEEKQNTPIEETVGNPKSGD